MTSFQKLKRFQTIKHLSISTAARHYLSIDSATWTRQNGRRCSMPRNWRNISRLRPIRSPVLRYKTRGSRKVTTELYLCDICSVGYWSYVYFLFFCRTTTTSPGQTERNCIYATSLLCAMWAVICTYIFLFQKTLHLSSSVLVQSHLYQRYMTHPYLVTV